MSKLVSIYGGSGFIGRYIARRMAKAGWRVRVAVRRPNEAMHVKPYGAVGQVEPFLCNVRDDKSVKAAMEGACAVVNCVGILSENRFNKFASVQIEGAERIARIAAAQGIDRFVHVSAMGADENAASQYLQTKAKGETSVREHLPSATILRPSVVFGTEDAFLNKFAAMTNFGPIFPLVAAETKFQPVFVDDVAAAAELAIVGLVPTGTYELGGPQTLTLRTLIDDMLVEIRKKKVVVNLPSFAGTTLAWSLDLAQKLTFGLFYNSVLTRDQLRSLSVDSVVSEGAKGFADLGISPTALGAIAPDYLWRFRPSGQYDAIKESAKNLKI
jgi:NADH dehydrogenase